MPVFPAMNHMVFRQSHPKAIIPGAMENLKL